MEQVEKSTVMKGKFSYDSEVDALFVRIPGEYKGSVCQRGFTIDRDPQGRIIAVEVLDASAVLGIPKEVLERHDAWECRITASDGVIEVSFAFSRGHDTVRAEVKDRPLKLYPETRIAVSA